MVPRREGELANKNMGLGECHTALRAETGSQRYVASAVWWLGCSSPCRSPENKVCVPGAPVVVALATYPALTLPSKTSLDTDVVPPLGPFPVIDPEEIIPQSKGSHVPEDVQCGKKHDTARMPGLFVLKG